MNSVFCVLVIINLLLPTPVFVGARKYQTLIFKGTEFKCLEGIVTINYFNSSQMANLSK